MAFHSACHCAVMFLSHNRKRFSKWVLSFFTDTKNNWRCPSYAMFCHLLFELFPVCNLDVYLPQWSFCPSFAWILKDFFFFWYPFPFSSPKVQKITKVSLGSWLHSITLSELPGGVRPTLKYILLVRVKREIVLAYAYHRPVTYCSFLFENVHLLFSCSLL